MSWIISNHLVLSHSVAFHCPPGSSREVPGLDGMAPCCLIALPHPLPLCMFPPYLSSPIPFPSLAVSVFNSMRTHEGRGNCPHSAGETMLLPSWNS